MTDRAGPSTAAFAAGADPGVEAPLADPYTLHGGGRSVEMRSPNSWEVAHPTSLTDQLGA